MGKVSNFLNPLGVYAWVAVQTLLFWKIIRIEIWIGSSRARSVLGIKILGGPKGTFSIKIYRSTGRLRLVFNFIQDAKFMKKNNFLCQIVKFQESGQKNDKNCSSLDEIPVLCAQLTFFGSLALAMILYGKQHVFCISNRNNDNLSLFLQCEKTSCTTRLKNKLDPKKQQKSQIVIKVEKKLKT